MNVEELLKNWAEARKQMSLLDKKMLHYKKIMAKYMTQNDLKQYENDHFRVRLGTQNRNMMHKKDVPASIWDQYATSRQIQVMFFTEKTKSS